MGLYINHGKHPNVFKATQEIAEPNQSYSRNDYVTELMNAQQQAYAELNQSLSELTQRTHNHETNQKEQWNQVDLQLNDLRNSALDRKNFENQMLTSIKIISEKNKQLEEMIDNEAFHKQEMMNQVDLLNKSIQEIAARLDRHETANQQLSQQMEIQLDLQKEAAEKWNEHEKFQGSILERLDKQEALTEKILRQLNHIRSILFERTNYLAEKIEDGYKVTSSYVYKLMTGSDQPLTFLLMDQHQENRKEQLEEK